MFFSCKYLCISKKSSTFAAESPVVPDASQTIGCRPFIGVSFPSSLFLSISRGRLFYLSRLLLCSFFYLLYENCTGKTALLLGYYIKYGERCSTWYP